MKVRKEYQHNDLVQASREFHKSGTKHEIDEQPEKNTEHQAALEAANQKFQLQSAEHFARIYGRKNQKTDSDKNAFTDITNNFDTLFDEAWKKSFPNGPDKKTQEWSGILLKTTEIDNGVEKSATYSIHNLQPGHPGYTSFNYSDIPESTPTSKVEVLGNFHTHPFSTKEVKNSKRQKPGFKGDGDIFSSNDFLVYSRLDKKYREKGQVFIVKSGKVIYGVEVLDAELAEKTFSSESFLTDVDYADSEIKKDDDRPYPDKIFEVYQNIIKNRGGEEKTGIRFYMKKQE